MVLNRYPYVKNQPWPYFTQYTIINPKLNIEERVCDFELGEHFLDMIQKAQNKKNIWFAGVHQN